MILCSVPRRQRGAALMIGLMLLLVLTIVAIAAIRATVQQERMAGNNQQQSLAFQAAEAGIRVVMNETRDVVAPPAGELMILRRAINLGTAPAQNEIPFRTAAADSSHAARATVVYTGVVNADGTDLSVESGKVVAHQFLIDSVATRTSTVSGVTETLSRAHHEQGISRLGPRL